MRLRNILRDPLSAVKEGQAVIHLAIDTANKINDMDITNLSSIALSKIVPNGIKEINRVVGSLQDKPASWPNLLIPSTPSSRPWPK
jgi:hypothetical protein